MVEKSGMDVEIEDTSVPLAVELRSITDVEIGNADVVLSTELESAAGSVVDKKVAVIDSDELEPDCTMGVLRALLLLWFDKEESDIVAEMEDISVALSEKLGSGAKSLEVMDCEVSESGDVVAVPGTLSGEMEPMLVMEVQVR